MNDSIVDIIMPYMIGLIVLVLIVTTIATDVKKVQKNSNKSLKKAKKEDAHGIVFGKKGRKVVYSPCNAEGSVGVFSASGTGKTSALGIPTLRAWTGTSFTIDISGDICKNCPDMKNKLIFEPDNADTVVYNIFASIDDVEDVGEKEEKLEQLAFLLMPNEVNASANSKFFNDNGRKILTASLIAFYFANMDFIKICEKIASSDYQTLFREIDNTKNKTAQMFINSFLGASEQNTAGCKQNCDDAIKLFATNSKIKKCIRRPLKDEIAVEPTAIESNNIFIIVEDPKLTLYAPLLNIIVSQQMQYISSRIVDDSSKTILLFLDEYASLHIESKMVLEALRKYRKRKCRIMIMTQNLADLDILYGKDTTKAILSNMHFKLLLGGLNEVESQKYFADLIGKKDTISKSISKSANSITRTESNNKQYIIEPSNLDKIDDDLILIHSCGYMKLKKNYYFK